MPRLHCEPSSRQIESPVPSGGPWSSYCVAVLTDRAPVSPTGSDPEARNVRRSRWRRRSALGAAGGLEAIFTLLSLRDQIIPPTINLDNPDEECDLNYTAKTAQRRRIDVALSNSFGFGGTNGSLLFRRL